MNDNSYITLQIKKEDINALRSVLDEGICALLMDDTIYINEMRHNYDIPREERERWNAKWAKEYTVASAIRNILVEQHNKMLDELIAACKKELASK